MNYLKHVASAATIAAAGLALAACGGPSSTAPTTASNPPSSPSVEAITPSPTTTTPTTPAVVRSARGNIVKKLRQASGVSDEENNRLVNFTVNSITVDAPCTGPYPQALENGHLVVLDVTIETTPELAKEGDGYDKFDMNGAMFKFVGANGTTFNGNLGTNGAFSCLPDEQMVPTTGVGPAEKVKAKIALDLPQTKGTLVFKSYLTTGNAGWEWTF
ncbi:hypothetical protein ACHMXB_01350 [Arthrobacter sp. UC242_113]|uniref:hypothetical protein n=1 Tax=Arthrobacter sp. UC242_113 TaxID=3374550 RepID=UPI00375675B0